MQRGKILDLLKWLIGGAAAQPAKPEPPPPPVTPAPVPQPSDVSSRLLALHNQLRATVGAKPLRLDPRLVNAAQRHSDWMAANRDMDHVEAPGTQGYTGKSFSDRARAAGYSMGGGGENIAAGRRTPDDTVNDWVHSPGHYTNIVDPRWVDVGFGVGRDAFGNLYWTAVFGVTLTRALQLAEEAEAPDAGPTFRTPGAVVYRGQW